MIRIGLPVGALVLLCDQLSKYWVLHALDLPARHSLAVLPVLNLTMVWNHGVTFGMMAGLGHGRADETMCLAAAQLCVEAGADPALVGPWPEEGRRRAARQGR